MYPNPFSSKNFSTFWRRCEQACVEAERARAHYAWEMIKCEFCTAEIPFCVLCSDDGENVDEEMFLVYQAIGWAS